MSRLFKSFFMGGFECSTHVLREGRRLDLIHSTRHEEFARQDYHRLTSAGMYTARDGLRWHLVDRGGGQYSFKSFMPLFKAAQKNGVQVIWDICHFGWPDSLDIFSPAFVDRLARFSRAFARFYRSETDAPLWFVPVVEISFLSWGGGDRACINPFQKKRADELKQQLVRAAIASTEAVWDVDPRARVVHVDPIIHIKPNPKIPGSTEKCLGYNQAQYAAWDMLSGRLAPELGGNPKYLDVIGVNYYPRNQWVDRAKPVSPRHPLFRPFREMLIEVCERYNRPVFISETGAENASRTRWLRYVATEACAAIQEGYPIEGLCLYPILNHPGWIDDRHCHNGLWDYADDEGNRPLFEPLARELDRQRESVEAALRAREDLMEAA